MSEVTVTIESLQEEIVKMQDKVDKANAEAGVYKRSGKDAKEKLSKFDGLDIDKYNDSIIKADAAEQDKLKQAGEYDKALEKGLKSSATEIGKLKDLIAGKDSKLSKVLIDNTILSAIDGKAVNNEQVLTLIRPNIKMEGDSPIVMDGESPRVNDKGEHVTVSDYAQSFIANNPHLAVPSGGGSGSAGNVGNNTQNKEGGSAVDRIAAGLKSLK